MYTPKSQTGSQIEKKGEIKMKKLLVILMQAVFMFAAEPEPTGEPTVEETQLKVIEEMKLKMETMVDPAKLAEVQKSYDALLNDYVNKRPAPKKEVVTLRPSEEIANELRNIKDGDMSNRDFVVKSLEYRNAYISEFGTDPWTDFSVNGSGEETAQTKKVASALQQLVDENQSNVDFRIKLQSTLRDDPKVIPMIRDREKQKNKRK